MLHEHVHNVSYLLVRAPDEGRNHFAGFRAESGANVGGNVDGQLEVPFRFRPATGSPFSRRPGFGELWFFSAHTIVDLRIEPYFTDPSAKRALASGGNSGS